MSTLWLCKLSSQDTPIQNVQVYTSQLACTPFCNVKYRAVEKKKCKFIKWIHIHLISIVFGAWESTNIICHKKRRAEYHIHDLIKMGQIKIHWGLWGAVKELRISSLYSLDFHVWQTLSNKSIEQIVVNKVKAFLSLGPLQSSLLC